MEEERENVRVVEAEVGVEEVGGGPGNGKAGRGSGDGKRKDFHHMWVAGRGGGGGRRS